MANEIMKSNGGPGGGMIQRQGFGEQSIQRTGETSSTAVAAQAKAEVEARFIMAIQRPRDVDEVRVRVLRECQRPGFAKVARYSKPIGGQKIQGPSIRFVEAVLRAMGNVMVTTAIVFEDAERRMVRVAVTDLESNTTIPTDILIEKTVERKKSEGRQVVGERTNSYGDTVYIVLATEDELLVKQAALVSKAIRTNGLRMIPGDLIEEGQAECIGTLKNGAAKNPDAEKKALVDAFSDLGIGPIELKKYLGHALDTVVPAELVDLRSVYAGIKDGEATWKETLEAKLAVPADSGAPPPDPAKANAAALAGQAEQAQQAAEGGSGQPSPDEQAPAVDPLADIARALAVSQTQRELLMVAKEIAKLSASLQPQAREAYNRRAEEIANAAP